MATTKIHSVYTTESRAVAYYINPEKTDNGHYVIGFMCDTSSAEKAVEDFQFFRHKYRHKKVLGQVIVQSFAIGEVQPETAFALGNVLADRLLGGEYQYIVATHIDKDHIHNHIYFNNTNMVNGKSFETTHNQGCNKSWKKIRELSDEICRENNLSVIENPEQGKGKCWYEWSQDKEGLSWKSKIKFALDEAIMQAENFEEFLRFCRAKNIEVSYTPQNKITLKFRMQGQKKFTRAKTLGWYYDEPQIRKRISEYLLMKNGTQVEKKAVRSKIINTENIDGSLKHWAEIQNMKEASKLINILSEFEIESKEQLENKSIQTYSERMVLVSKLNDIQHRINKLSDNINSLKKYRQHKPIYEQYRQQKNKKAFEEQYHSQLQAFSMARAELKASFPEKIPKEEELVQRRKELERERDELNLQYQNVIKQLKQLDYARSVLDRYLEMENQTDKTKQQDIE